MEIIPSLPDNSSMNAIRALVKSRATAFEIHPTIV